MPGAYLKQVRERLGLTARQVEQLSRIVVKAVGGKEYFISHGWLTKIEHGNSTPGIYTLFSLSVIYRLHYSKLLSRYGINLETTEECARLIKLPPTHSVDQEIGSFDAFPDLPGLTGSSALNRGH